MKIPVNGVKVHIFGVKIHVNGLKFIERCEFPRSLNLTLRFDLGV